MRHNGVSFQAIGYVVAANPFGEAYVVPLHDAVTQINQTMGATRLGLPDPGGLLADLVAHYNTGLYDHRTIEQAKSILASAVRSGTIDMRNLLPKAASNGKWSAVEALLEAYNSHPEPRSIKALLLLQLLDGYHEATREPPTTSRVSIPSIADLLLHAAVTGSTHLGAFLLSMAVEFIMAKTSDQRQATPLHLASEHGHKAFVRLLLGHGADIETTTSDSRRATSLHLAAEKGHYDIVRVLVERGADTETETAGQTAIQLAEQNGHEAVVRLLLEWTVDDRAKTDNYHQHRDLRLATQSQYTSANLMTNLRQDYIAAPMLYDSADDDLDMDDLRDALKSGTMIDRENTSISEGWAPSDWLID